jgi:hypothetical protein
MKKYLAIWLSLMLAGIFTAGCVYIVAQQTIRMGENAPAAAIAYETRIKLENGQAPDQATGKTDIRVSLEPFVMIYDAQRKLVATSASYGSESLVIPPGVFDSIDKNGDNRVTWQPKPGLRFATVGIKHADGYIIGCVSLTEAEKLINQITLLLLVGSAAYAIGCAILLGVISLIRRRVH